VVDPARLPRRGIAPYGWRRNGRGGLVSDEHEQHVRWLILHMHRQGYGYGRIAGELYALNLGTRDGGETWPKTTLHRIVTTAARLEATG
jgi:hypothetical protein